MIRLICLTTLLLGSFVAVIADDHDHSAALKKAAEGDHRSDAHKARNQHRHPVETLSFFGIKPNMTVVEVSPGGSAWYSEILAPFLREEGKLYLAGYDVNDKREYVVKNREKLAQKLADNPDVYDKVQVTEFNPPKKKGIAPEGSVDMVLTFRNTHGWMRGGIAPNAFEIFYKVLKPGGVLGVVQHRADPNIEAEARPSGGYVNQDYLIKMAEHAGFILVASSEINANPKDTKDHPKGVWSLPPTYADGDEHKAKFEKIGESDRMTLKFVKP
ncbi:class I SAM-dependent methyltransferase [Acanthopleuribacter pedis]|uniref:Class I SAM-dependent methyltransferase n=1 Tax=Acanthopleuribacter pedis TaxID=442870 RepID=A0A8J7Q3A3_9BACT|nr:class I SAM-dependent methyltransferase [Acanthopleuribacter pedis]MBO1317664.1 class I SAM-dependent methyltransferase [Acanthopleuribacter pedis]